MSAEQSNKCLNDNFLTHRRENVLVIWVVTLTLAGYKLDSDPNPTFPS